MIRSIKNNNDKLCLLKKPRPTKYHVVSGVKINNILSLWDNDYDFGTIRFNEYLSEFNSHIREPKLLSHLLILVFS